MRTAETAQTFLNAAEVDALVGDYLAGMSVKALAERYGVHRATVFSQLRRRNVPSRRTPIEFETTMNTTATHWWRDYNLSPIRAAVPGGRRVESVRSMYDCSGAEH